MLVKLCDYIKYLIRFVLKVKLNKRIECDSFVKIQGGVKIIIEANSSIQFGKNVVLKNNTILYAKKNATIVIGDNSSTGHHTEISAGKSIIIGNDVIMGAYTYITDSNHEFSKVNIPIRMQGMKIGKVSVGNNVWIGRGVYLLMNSSIGDNTVVAASSVVTKEFEGNHIIGGIPAKKLKQLIGDGK